LNDVIQDLLLSRWRRHRKVRLFFDPPDLRNDSRTLVEQGNDLLIGLVYLLSAGRKSSFGVGDLLAVASNRAEEQEWYACTAAQDCIQSRCRHFKDLHC
jgi:hypothetical protein